ncbi:unnamed protein product [Phytomonas sp. Hart1]|nr:unnamed protein product [Phytomonas sp. Hart1]|eukprot:CCW69109.1 unnamed protein product [Phytomonas sp. isolate Hart1]
MSDDGEEVALELPQIWKLIHPHYNEESSDEESPGTSPLKTKVEDYLKLSKRSPRLSMLLRLLNNVEDIEELQQLVLVKDPVTQQTLLQWCTLNNHFMLSEYLVRRLQRGAFAFDPEFDEIVVYDRWDEMRPELPTAEEVAERQRQRDNERVERMALRAQQQNDDEEDYEEDENDEDYVEAVPAELVYNSLEEFHEQWGDRGVGLVKRIGELGVYFGSRLRDGTKEGLGQTLFPTGDCYAGLYRQNERHGKGIYWWSQTSALYCGDWVGNLRHGYGRMVYPDGSRYLGHWTNDSKNGQGRYIYVDGSNYDGMWVNNEKHGRGRYNFTDGSSYLGSFFHNDFVSGEWRLACGTVCFVGSFIKDVPVGAGVFVHRCGIKPGSFMQEGIYQNGRWIPGEIKKCTKLDPFLEVVVPGQDKCPRVPMEFGAALLSEEKYTIVDLVKVANFTPFQRWLSSLSTGSSGKVILKRVEVVAIKVAQHNYNQVIEIKIRPLLVNFEGVRINTELSEEERIITLRESSMRLLLVLVVDEEPLVVLESLPMNTNTGSKGSTTDTAYGLPEVRWTADGRVEGEVIRSVMPALRLDINKSTLKHLTEPSGAFSTEDCDIWMYAQVLHPDTLSRLEETFESLPSFKYVPLSTVQNIPTDVTTGSVVSEFVHVSREGIISPLETAPNQRPPTPILPPVRPRPEMQPLYDAKAALEGDFEKDD